MLKKLIMLAITSGVAAKLYKSYASQKRSVGPQSSADATSRKVSPRPEV